MIKCVLFVGCAIWANGTTFRVILYVFIENGTDLIPFGRMTQVVVPFAIANAANEPIRQNRLGE